MPVKAVWGILVVLLLGCDERERLTFETDPEDKVGPSTHIDPPSQDTTLTEGDLFVVGARTVDTSGIDTVFIEVEGANLNYLPLDAHGVDTLSFSINLPTIGLSGRTITLGVFGVDVIGNVGPTVSRHITIE
ncbi:MAG TPA: hypothetical protein VM094_04310 [Gemmatimonadales bacterium]|nr:hypothetical protein [Gemmatimonadales bacterium]